MPSKNPLEISTNLRECFSQQLTNISKNMITRREPTVKLLITVYRHIFLHIRTSLVTSHFQLHVFDMMCNILI